VSTGFAVSLQLGPVQVDLPLTFTIDSAAKVLLEDDTYATESADKTIVAFEYLKSCFASLIQKKEIGSATLNIPEGSKEEIVVPETVAIVDPKDEDIPMIKSKIRYDAEVGSFHSLAVFFGVISDSFS